MGKDVKKAKVSPDVIMKFCEKDEEAFKIIYESYFHQVYFFVYHNISDKSLTQDIVQNTFIAALKGAHQLKHVNAFPSWLMRIAFCESKNIYRKNNMKKVDINDENDLDILEGEQNNRTDLQFEKNQLYETVYASISKMRPKLKDVAILKYVDGFSDEEISKILKVPLGTVKSRSHRIRASLKSQLKTKNITPASYKRLYSIGIPALIVAGLTYGKEFVCIGSIESAEQVYELSKSAISTGVPAFEIVRNIIFAASSLSVVGALVFLLLPTKETTHKAIQQPPAFKTLEAKENATIQSINYDKSFTNTVIEVEVVMSNDEYDEILLNGTNELIVRENGEHVLSVWNKGTEIEKKTFYVSNIDTQPPYFISHIENENKYTLQLGDNLSGIDKTSILYWKDGVISENYHFDEVNNVIYFVYDEYSENIFEIKDYANNFTKISIKSTSLAIEP